MSYGELLLPIHPIPYTHHPNDGDLIISTSYGGLNLQIIRGHTSHLRSLKKTPRGKTHVVVGSKISFTATDIYFHERKFDAITKSLQQKYPDGGKEGGVYVIDRGEQEKKLGYIYAVGIDEAPLINDSWRCIGSNLSQEEKAISLESLPTIYKSCLSQAPGENIIFPAVVSGRFPWYEGTEVLLNAVKKWIGGLKEGESGIKNVVWMIRESEYPDRGSVDFFVRKFQKVFMGVPEPELVHRLGQAVEESGCESEEEGEDNAKWMKSLPDVGADGMDTIGDKKTELTEDVKQKVKCPFINNRTGFI